MYIFKIFLDVIKKDLYWKFSTGAFHSTFNDLHLVYSSTYPKVILPFTRCTENCYCCEILWKMLNCLLHRVIINRTNLMHGRFYWLIFVDVS